MTTTTGLDTAVAPPAATAKAALDAVGGSWWAVYLPSGTRNGGSGWTPELVKEYARKGVREFLPLWVGNQDVPSLGLADPLSAELGHEHARLTCQDMADFGWPDGTPVGLDTEYDTAVRNPGGALAYCDGWSVGVREGGYLPGDYGPLAFLAQLFRQTNRPDWAYAADWIRSGVDHGLDPAQIAGLGAGFWQGARVWQYAGGSTYVNGLSVDIDVADFPLALAPGVARQSAGAIPPPAAAYKVTVAHYLRTTPVLVASHGPLVTGGERLIALGPRTTHWAQVETTPQGPQGWAYLPNLQPSE